MKVLWFEVTVPSAYKTGGIPIGGWQDSLERIVRTIPDIELTIAFVSEEYSVEKVIEGVTYVPICVHWSLIDRVIYPHWDVFVRKVLPKAILIVEKYEPDLIQIFGTEWPFGQIAAFIDIPIVVHIMGAIVPYNNANNPPGYSFWDHLYGSKMSPFKLYGLYMSERDNKNWEQWERRTWQLVNNFMGRTHWDESLSRVLHPGRNYYHVEEALRSIFLTTKKKWEIPTDGKIKLVSIGCSSFWKGPDMILKVANILRNIGIDFDWYVVGAMSSSIKQIVERKQKQRFEDNHIIILGFKQPRDLVDILCSSTMYVHPAYIENSPNSICEAQCLGVPVVSTNVGGISSLVRHGVDGLLIPANDPWQMADAIVELSKDKKRMALYSINSQRFALARHNDEHIKSQLINCYNKLLCNKHD